MLGRLFAQKDTAVPPMRVQRLRAVRRKRRLVLAGVLVVLLCIACVVFAWASHSSRFAVEQIHVEGTQELSPDVIRAFAEGIMIDGRFHVIARNTILFYPRQKITNALLAQYPRINTVTIQTDSIRDRTITITITERNTFALWCDTAGSGSCYRVDDTGFVFEPASSQGDTLVVYGRVVPHVDRTADAPLWGSVEPEYFEQLRVLVQELSTFSFVPTSARIEDHDAYIQLKSGFEVRVDVLQNPGATVNALVSVLTQDQLVDVPKESIEYVDVRFGERIFYKLRE